MLGETIRNLRKEHNISQEEFAEKLGVSRQSVSLWENGQTLPSIENIVTIANIFNVSTDLLLKGNSQSEPLTEKIVVINRKLKAWEIVLLALGSPVWLSLIVAAVAVVLSVYVSIWAIVISLWSVFASFVTTAVVGVVGGLVLAFSHGLTGLAIVGAGVALGGLAIFSFFACKAFTKGVVLLTRSIIFLIKRIFVKREAL